MESVCRDQHLTDMWSCGAGDLIWSLDKWIKQAIDSFMWNEQRRASSSKSRPHQLLMAITAARLIKQCLSIIYIATFMIFHVLRHFYSFSIVIYKRHIYGILLVLSSYTRWTLSQFWTIDLLIISHGHTHTHMCM